MISGVRRSLAWLAAGLLAILVLAVPGTASAAPQSFTTGITIPDAGFVPQLAYDRIAQAGGSVTRVTVFWERVAPAEKPENWDPTDPADPHYNWMSPDDQVVKAADAGLTTIVQIHGAPAWAERCKSPGEPGICNPNPTEFRKFTEAVVERYSGDFGSPYNPLPKVRLWKPWNEPNLHIYFEPQRQGKKRPSPGLYRTLLNNFADVVKAKDPNNLVVGGGLAPLGGTESTHPLDFMRRLFCMQGRKKPKPIRGCKGTARFDIWATNPYTTGGPTKSALHRDDVQLGDLPEVTRLIRAAKRAGKIKSNRNIRLWVTEFSYDSAPPDPGGLKMPLLKRWAAEAMFRTWKAGFDTFLWLSLRDWNRPDGVPYSQTYESGLWFRGASVEQDRPKALLRVYRAPFVALRQKRGVTVWGRTLNAKPGWVVVRFGQRANRVNRFVKRIRANKNGIYRGFIRTRFGQNRRGFMAATSRGFTSAAHPLRFQRDFHHPPFGRPTR